MVNSIQRQIQPLNPQLRFNVNSIQKQIQLPRPQMAFNINSNERFQNPQPLNHILLERGFNVNSIE